MLAHIMIKIYYSEYSLSYADDMVLLAPTVTHLQTLLQVCRAYAGPHDIVYNTTTTECMLVRPKQSQGLFSTRVKLGNEELGFVEEFRYLEHVMTVDCRDDKDIKKQFRRQNAVDNMLVRKFSFASIEAKNVSVQVILLPHLWMCSVASFIRELY